MYTLIINCTAKFRNNCIIACSIFMCTPHTHFFPLSHAHFSRNKFLCFIAAEEKKHSKIIRKAKKNVLNDYYELLCVIIHLLGHRYTIMRIFIVRLTEPLLTALKIISEPMNSGRYQMIDHTLPKMSFT